MSKDIKIILIDDQEIVRRGLRSMLEQEEDMEIVDDCSNAQEAFSKIARLCPDIVLMDIQMPGINGIEATRSLKRNGLDYSGDVIMLAESLNYRIEALQAGAASYLLKDALRTELAQAIRKVYRSKQSVENGECFVEETVELVVLPPADAAWLLRFMYQLGGMLHDNFVGIIGTVGSWDHSTVVTLGVQPAMFAAFLIQLANMPEVEELAEEPAARGGFSSFPEKSGVLLKSVVSPSKRFRVTLKEDVTVEQNTYLS